MMKNKVLSLWILLLTAVPSIAQTLVVGDMNSDGTLTVGDVSALAYRVVNNTADTLNLSPFRVDNSYVVGTWYKSDGTSFTFNENGTTTYPGGTTYAFYPGQNRLVVKNSAGKALYILPIVEATSDYLLSVDYATGSTVYYTNSSAMVSSVTLDQTSLAMNSGTTAQLTATASPSGSGVSGFTWASSDESVATVDEDGLVTAVAGGTCTVTATAADGSGVSSSCTVTVTQMVTSITLSQTIAALELDAFVRLTATVLPSNAANTNVTWSSSNEDVATVRNGRIDAYGYGTAVITCTAADGSGVSASCMVKVRKADTMEYVDLGLPSGTLWATCNIGASSPEEYGDYFAWGETSGYNEGKSDFSWSTYTYCEGSDSTLTKYCNDSNYGYNGFTDTLTELELSDDAAYVNWGSSWRMPSIEQFNELIDSVYTTAVWTTFNGVVGYQITSIVSGYTDNSIFLPAAGCYNDTSLSISTWYGCYWSRTLNTGLPNVAWFLDFWGGVIRSSVYDNRFSGRSVRPVRLSE